MRENHLKIKNLHYLLKRFMKKTLKKFRICKVNNCLSNLNLKAWKKNKKKKKLKNKKLKT